jgi:GNAT superfamily N-acetyltransferase
MSVPAIIPLDPFRVPAYQAMTFPAYASLFTQVGYGETSPLIARAAEVDGEPAGLALAWMPAAGRAQWVSLFVRPAYRRQGIASRLAAGLEEAAAGRACRELTASFERGRPMRDVVEHLLAARGYATPRLRALMCRVHDGGARLKTAPWFYKTSMPASFKIFPWPELTAEERRTILERQASAPWYPSNLDPFGDERIMEPLNSLGLRLNGEVIGWSITHRIFPDTIRYTYLFVREDLQPFGIAIPLLLASMRGQIDSPIITTVPNATFKVPLTFGGMVKFLRGRMAPYVSELNDVVDTVKRIG